MSWIETVTEVQHAQAILKERYRVADNHRLVQALREARLDVPQEIALSLCKQIQQGNRYPLARWRCHHCVRRGQDGIPLRLMPPCRCARVSRRYHATA